MGSIGCVSASVAEPTALSGAQATIAIKVFHDQPDLAEMRLLARLDHPHMLRYRTTLLHDGKLCLVTDYADGGDAAVLLQAYPDGLPAEQVRAIIRPLAEALAYLHGERIVHRDVKPLNLLFVNGTLRLADVGLAKALEQSSMKGSAIATPLYAAPELFKGEISTAADIYALGITAYELLTGRPPFEGTIHDVMMAHISQTARWPTHVPVDLVELFSKCLHKEPRQRPTALQVREELIPVPPPPPTPPHPPRKHWLLAGIALATGIWLAGRESPSPPPPPAPTKTPSKPPTPKPLPKVDQRVNSLTKLLAKGQSRQAVLDASWLLVRDGRDVSFRQKVIPLLRGITFNAEHRASAATLRADGMRVYRNGAAYWKRHQDLAGRMAIFEAAARLFGAAEKRAPGDVEPVFNRAVIYMELSRPEAALPLFQAVAASARPGQEGIRKRAQVLGERCRIVLKQKGPLP